MNTKPIIFEARFIEWNLKGKAGILFYLLLKYCRRVCWYSWAVRTLSRSRMLRFLFRGRLLLTFFALNHNFWSTRVLIQNFSAINLKILDVLSEEFFTMSMSLKELLNIFFLLIGFRVKFLKSFLKLFIDVLKVLFMITEVVYNFRDYFRFFFFFNLF